MSPRDSVMIPTRIKFKTIKCVHEHAHTRFDKSNYFNVHVLLTFCPYANVQYESCYRVFSRYRARERPGDSRVLLPAEERVCGDGWCGQPVLTTGSCSSWSTEPAERVGLDQLTICRRSWRPTQLHKFKRKRAWRTTVI